MNGFSHVTTARALAQTFTSMRELGIANRHLFDGILRETLACNPQYLGVWTVWEPNALDGRDCDFANTPGHDGSGRYIPLWNRGGGSIHLEPNTGYNEPGVGDWYLLPRERGEETVVDPYEFTFAGVPEFIMSQVSPIFFRGKWVGATGVDIAMDELVCMEDLRVEETLRRGFVFLDERGGVDYWSGRTRDLLASYTGGKLGRELPASIANHVSRLRRQGGNNKTPQPAELPALRRGNTMLSLKFSRHPQSGRVLFIVEETAATGEELTSRETEVLEWLRQGKSNYEIGIILGISIHTVKRHVERILAKLGAENRFAAALTSMDVRLS